jgi:hypothetical protein
VQIAPETCRAKDEKNKEYGIHLVGLELNIYITKMYGNTNIKFSKIEPSNEARKTGSGITV